MDTPIGTIDLINTPENHIIRDVSTLFSYIDSNTFPFDTLLRQMPMGPKAQSWKIEWESVKKHPRYDVVEAGQDYAGGEAAGTAVTLHVDNAGMWRVKDSINVVGDADAPPLHVRAVDTTAGTITVVALATIGAVGATAAGLGVVPALPAGTKLAWLGNIQEEGFTYSDGRAMMPTFGFNYEELSDLVVDITKTRQAIRNYSQLQDWERAQRDQFKEARRTAELKAWFQVASYTKNASGKYQWSMNGVTRYITKKKQYAKNATNGSRITEFALIDWMVELFSDNTGTRDRFFFVDAYLSGELDKALVKTTWNSRSEYRMGVKCKRVETTQGDISIVNAPLFNEYGHDHYGVILDLESISMRPLREMEANKLNLKSVGVDKDAVQLLEQTSLEVLNPDAHMEIQGVDVEQQP